MKNNYLEHWHYYKHGIISRDPDYIDVLPTKNEAHELFKRWPKAFYIRSLSNFDKQEKGKFYSVIKDGEMNINTLPPKTRNMVRRCLKNCTIRLVDYQHIINSGGYDIYLSEIKRYEKNGHPAPVQSKEKWTNGKVESATRGEEYWGVFLKDTLIAYGIVVINGKEAGLVTWKCDYENYKEFYPSYGLVYTMTKHYLERNDIEYVNDGSRTLTGHSTVQDYLESKFNYRKAYTKLNVIFKWYALLPVAVLSLFEKHIKNNGLLSIIRLYKWSR